MPSFTFTFNLGEKASTAQLLIGERVVSSSQKATGLSPSQSWLELPKEGHPSLWVLFFSRTQLPCPAPAQPRHPMSTCPQPVVPTPAPRWKGGERAWRGKDVVCACLLPWPKHCYLAVRGCFRWVSGMRDKERKSRLSSKSGSSRGGGGRAGPHLLAGCRGNGRHRGPSSPRQSKQDRWAWAWRD